VFYLNKISVDKFNPYIISVRYFNGKVYEEGKVFPERNVYDYELEYIPDGNGTMVFDGVVYPLQGGTTFFRKPHDKNYGIMPYESYLIIFDASGNCRNNSDQFTIGRKRFQPLKEIDIPIPSVTRFFYKEKVESILKCMHMEFMQSNPLKPLLLKSYFYQLINEILLLNSNQKCDCNLNLTPIVQKRIEICIKYINENFKSDIDISKLSLESNISPSHLYRAFKLAIGQSPIQYMLKLRICHAKRLLVQTEKGVKEVSYECGFEDPSYFCKIFKQKTGVTPLFFRETYPLKFL